jgi:hypothetical protein
MFEETVTREMVEPTDCALTSQKLANLPHVLALGMQAIQAEATVQRMLANVAVASLEFGTFRVIVPPISRATICTVSPTDLSWNLSAVFSCTNMVLLPE